ncbi:MAG TPA: DMT family transporter [Rhodocyclaceae bacterium]
MQTLYALLALAIGLVVPLQAAVNHQLKLSIGGSTIMAALISFACGTLTLAVAALVMQEKWSALAGVARVPAWQLTGGAMGALFVFGTTLLAPRLGFAVMVALIVTGQIVSSLAFDRIGLLGIPVRELSTPRLIGAVLAVIGVVLVNFGDRLEGLATK